VIIVGEAGTEMGEAEKLNKFLRDREKWHEQVETGWQRYKKDRPDCVRKLTEELEEKIGRCFTPWVGNNYCGCEGKAPSGFGIRVLVVGDSTYRGNLLPEKVFKSEYERDGTDWFNKTGVFQYKSGCWLDRYWTKWTDTLICNSVEEKDRPKWRQNVLDNVAFYNFCDWILDAARTWPEVEAFAKGMEKFPQILTILKPDLVVLTTFRVRDALFVCNQYQGINELEGYKFVRNHVPPLLCLPHPSGAMKWWKRPRVRTAVEKALQSVCGHLLCPE